MNSSNDLMANIIAIGKQKLVETALNNPEKIAGIVSKLAIENGSARTILKTLDWAPNDFGEYVKNILSYSVKAYREREGFAKANDERMEAFARTFAELSGYGCLTPIEARMLAAGYAKFNGKEIHKIFKLEGKMTVEQVQAAIEAADKKYREAAQAAGVGMVGVEVEPSSEVDLEAIASELEKKNLADAQGGAGN